jgi:hypothetical protein
LLLPALTTVPPLWPFLVDAPDEKNTDPEHPSEGPLLIKTAPVDPQQDSEAEPIDTEPVVPEVGDTPPL